MKKKKIIKQKYVILTKKLNIIMIIKSNSKVILKKDLQKK